MTTVEASAAASETVRTLSGSFHGLRASTVPAEIIAAAALVPSIFRRDSPADVDSFRLQQQIGEQQARPFGRAEDSARRLTLEIAISTEQARPFLRVEDSARRLAAEIARSEEQARPFRRVEDSARRLANEVAISEQQVRPFKREDLDRRLLIALGFVRR